ncbi:short-subunit dehydrogenase [Novosphingobium chloroacetimidivorans]|uniref:Short-subunit dehydrogenase n=1 Tax=Novosphingobium chloroacetimidivorans TaxID=1428314 RepID=A0A7W7KC99_9SPHN|nr:SDR family NAD(P)-dependent oxidoreductase [Novosphingobium chloroacetimidivorans]MBB4860177.1 short-subunit dehydrogenase [Novosphingobium chloroacetimidivorans]
MGKHSVEALSGFVVVTGASSGIGLELAKLAAQDGASLLLVADRDLTEGVAAARAAGAPEVESLQVDLATDEGVEQVIARIGGRRVAALFANAGHGLGKGFLDQEWEEARHVIDTNVTGTVHLIHAVARQMRARNEGRILVTGSIAGHIPGTFQLVYNSTKAFIDDFCNGLSNELKDTNVVITCLEPGPVDTEFFERAGMLDTNAGQGSKSDPAKVARDGYKALLSGDLQITSGFMNKVQSFFSDILPDEVVAQMHRRMAEPKSGSTQPVHASS